MKATPIQVCCGVFRIVLASADKSGSGAFSKIFPRLTLATSDTPITRPCYVPFIAREGPSRDIISVLDTPEAPTGPITEAEVRDRIDTQVFSGLVKLVRRNSNIFAATFIDWRSAQRPLKL